MPIVNIVALAVPALFGALAGVIFGHRQVRALREKTGDDSTITTVLSGDFLRAQEARKKAA